ncbi:hypothetical protein [Halomonas piscis]|uniref:hypothetical protein n=1 Tax=Halomonas piscis TaxID=3031727 RepID=UPI00289E578C|nr:hypothetical protein [Halomonas piscis]
MSENAASSRIVPDASQSLGPARRRQPSRPRLWPLWLFIVLLIAAMAALAAGAWLERERLLDELSRVKGEVSNVHARLDSGDGKVQDRIALIQAQLSTLFQEQEQLSVRFNGMREELLDLVPASEDIVSAEAIKSLLAQVKEQEQAASLRDDRLAALGASLDSLESAAESEHGQLDDDIAHLETTLADRLERQAQAYDERLASLNEALATLADDMAALDQGGDAGRETLAKRLDALESDVRQLRQSQLAFSAQLEMLR